MRTPFHPSKKMRIFHWIPLNNIQLQNTFWMDHIKEGDKDIDVRKGFFRAPPAGVTVYFAEGSM